MATVGGDGGVAPAAAQNSGQRGTRVVGDILVDDPPWNLIELKQHYSARHGGEFTAGRPGIRDNTAARRDRSHIVATSGVPRLADGQ
jgi:hypothetical protein